MRNTLIGMILCVLSVAAFSFAAGGNTGGVVQSKPFQVVNPMNAPVSSKPFTILFFYDPKCDTCKKMLEQVEKIRYNLKEYVEFKMYDVTQEENKKLAEQYNFKSQPIRLQNTDMFGNPKGTYTISSDPYPALVAFGKTELYRLQGPMDESNLSPKLDAAGVRRPPVDPFLKMKLSSPPYVSGKGKVMIFSAPPGKLDIRVFNREAKFIREIENKGALLFWDLKDSSGADVPPGSYVLTIKDKDAVHIRNFDLEVK